MPTPPFPILGHRAITAYNRLVRELAALNYTVRIAKPAGSIGAVSRQSIDRAIRTASRRPPYQGIPAPPLSGSGAGDRQSL